MQLSNETQRLKDDNNKLWDLLSLMGVAWFLGYAVFHFVIKSLPTRKEMKEEERRRREVEKGESEKT